MSKRLSITALLIFALSTTSLTMLAWAGDQRSHTAVVGWLVLSAGPNDPAVQALRAGLRELGYVDGQEFRIEHRSAEGHVDRLPPLADDLVRSKVDLILTATSDGTRAAMRATDTIPIVAVVPVDDPVALGFIESLNRPGRNVTGVTTRNTSLAGKRLELLRELLPSVTHVAVFWDSTNKAELELVKKAAASLGVRIHPVDLAPDYDLKRAFREAKAQRLGAVTVLGSAPLYVRAAQLGAFALDNKLPIVGQWRPMVDAGGLMSYGTDVTEAVSRSVHLIDRLLKGAKASELPFEQTDRIKLVLNMKTAQSLGIAVPHSMLVAADETIR